jgi:pimeloyl-ACP methyl ester carboxylesterase
MAFVSNKLDRADTAEGMITSDAHYVYKDACAQLISELREEKFEEVYINSSHDGAKLFARYYHYNDNAPTDILCHGYRGKAFRDFCGGHKLAREMGHNILLIDQRGHGKSQKNVITFGILERHDIVDWANYITNRFPKKDIMLYGISMGGASVIMASELNLPKNVVGIVADCPFSSPSAVIKHTVKSMPFPLKFGYPFVKVGARLFGGFSLEDSTAVTAVKNAKVPITIIHGEDDDFVPCSMSYEIKNANPNVSLNTFKGATHGVSYMVDEERYKKIISEFNAKITTH